MDELWQRYRTFWTQILIGLGVFLIGLIVVHVGSDNPEVASRRASSQVRKAMSLYAPQPRKIGILQQRGEDLAKDVAGDPDTPGAKPGWAQRLDETGGQAKDRLEVACQEALRAAVLRGAPDEIARVPGKLAERFDGDDVAAAKAWKHFEDLVGQHAKSLRSGDPNVALSRLLTDVWGELRLRANRADVEIGPQADQLGFGSIASVSRATLVPRVLNLALAARVADVAIRQGMQSIDAIDMRAQVDPGDPEDFIVLWPVKFTLTGDMAGVREILDLLTDPDAPVPLETTSLTQPRQRSRTNRQGTVQLDVTACSAIVRPQADLKLQVEEKE